MANIVLKTFAAGDEGQGTVTPQDDALIYQNAVSVNGIFGGATVTLTGANTLHIASGFGIICGRFFEINESDISVQLSSSGTLSGRLKIHLDLNNADNPIEIVTETGATLPALSGDSNININGGAFDMELCTFSVNELTISSLVNTFPTIGNTSKQIRRKTAYAVNDFVLCQSASDAFIFICTTAGTTAVQEPTAYASVASGSSVTDGTAVFKAYNLYSWIEGKAPKSHTSTNTTYGIGTPTKYGHCMTINGLTQSSHADGKALSAYQGKVLNDKISKTEVLANNAQQIIAPILSSLVAPSGGLESGDQFIYNGLLYKATAPISEGGTIVIDGNAELADCVTEQIAEIISALSNKPDNPSWGSFARAIQGTYTGNTGKSTFTFRAISTVSYLICAGTTLISTRVSTSTTLGITMIKADGTITNSDITGSNWTFEISGLPWYTTPIAFTK